MNPKLIFAIATITLALIFYTIGVWFEHRSKTLKRWHVVTFWAGLFFDTTGTLTMGTIAQTGGIAADSVTRLVHGASGALSIILMQAPTGVDEIENRRPPKWTPVFGCLIPDARRMLSGR